MQHLDAAGLLVVPDLPVADRRAGPAVDDLDVASAATSAATVRTFGGGERCRASSGTPMLNAMKNSSVHGSTKK